MNNQTPSQSSSSETPKITARVIIRFLVMTIFMLSVLFLAAGCTDWWEAWAYVGTALVILIVSRVPMLIKNPDMALERAEAAQKEDVEPWDKILLPLTAIYGPLISWIIAGLDVRFGWSPDLPDYIQIIALVVINLGSLFGTWAMLVNRFFSSQVRIQTDRGHTVVSSGPYRIVRHPGYAGAILSWIASPIFFSSYWLSIPAVLMIIANILRTALEDRTLQEELPGYQEYTRRVRYRILPGIW
jgi:protein-S-isoprenylcysteine O-methyltransferase Ste14